MSFLNNVSNYKKEILESFIKKYFEENSTDSVLGMVLCGSFKNDDNNEFSDIDVQIIMDETFSDDSNINKNGGNIVRGVELIGKYRFEYFARNIQGYYYEAREAHKQQKNALLTIIGHGQIFFYKDEDSLRKIIDLQKFILDLYSIPLPLLNEKDMIYQMYLIYEDISTLLQKYNNGSKDFLMHYYLLLEKIRKFYSRSTGCCYLPPAKVWKIYHNKEYADRFCKSKIPDDEFILRFTECIQSDNDNFSKINSLMSLANFCRKQLNITNLIMDDYFPKEDDDNTLLDENEILELIVILENRRIKVNEKYVNNSEDFKYFYYIVLQMIDRFSLKINKTLKIIDEQYLKLYYLAKTTDDTEEMCSLVNALIDEIKKKYESTYLKKVNPSHYKVLVKPTTWNSNKQSRF